MIQLNNSEQIKAMMAAGRITGEALLRARDAVRPGISTWELDRIVRETDCPYLAPEPNRGKRNSSLNIPYVIAVMAQIKGITEEEVRKAAWDNSLRLYHIEK